MPITALDKKTALVVIDMQRGIVGMPLAHPVEGVVANVAALAGAFRAHHQLTVLVNVRFAEDFADALRPRADVAPPAGAPAPDFAVLIDELHADSKRDLLITKHQWGAFYGTELDLQLRRRGITGIVLCGIATSIGVESTARSAYEHGYNLSFAVDAMTDRTLEAHENAVQRIFPRIGEVGATAAVIARLG
jgi:nicotinamidase-related amidase